VHLRDEHPHDRPLRLLQRRSIPGDDGHVRDHDPWLREQAELEGERRAPPDDGRRERAALEELRDDDGQEVGLSAREGPDVVENRVGRPADRLERLDADPAPAEVPPAATRIGSMAAVLHPDGAVLCSAYLARIPGAELRRGIEGIDVEDDRVPGLRRGDDGGGAGA
jgi:hypothetical protein